MKKLYYKYSDLEDFIVKLETEHGYNCVQTWEGCLGIGNWILVSPDTKHYNFIIREEYKNPWQSVHYMMKCSKLPKKYEQELENYYINEQLEEA